MGDDLTNGGFLKPFIRYADLFSIYPFRCIIPHVRYYTVLFVSRCYYSTDIRLSRNVTTAQPFSTTPPLGCRLCPAIMLLS